MKKLVFASVMALASLSLVSAPTLRAQDITIKDPAEFNAYSMASTQADPKAKASELEDLPHQYPQSVVKMAVLNHAGGHLPAIEPTRSSTERGDAACCRLIRAT